MIHRIRQHSIHATINSFRALEQQALLPSCLKFLSSFCYEGAGHRQASYGRGVALDKAAQTFEDPVPANLPWAYNSTRSICTSLTSRAVPAVSADNLLAELQEAEEEQSRDKKPARFVDRLRVTVQAGKGGNGSTSFWASKRKGKFRPADGGSGGNGGDVILQASQRVKSLNGLNHLHKAGAGQSGGKQKLAGARGKDIIIEVSSLPMVGEVPVGTVVYLPEEAEAEDEELPFWVINPGEPWIGARDYRSDEEEDSAGDYGEGGGASSEAVLKQRLGREVADLNQPGQRVVLASGGQGGRGNASFPSKTSRSGQDLPTGGAPGERVVACLEIRSLADIGLVGFPNAGKSSLLKILSAATPKVASYPFTTLQPHLGAVNVGEEVTLTVADIPGLLPGAARNRGLGHAFLRHISRARALVYVVDASGGLGEDGESPRPWEQLQNLQEELRQYSPQLVERPALVVANKVDRLRREGATLAAIARRTGLQVVGMCALPGNPGHSPAAVQELKRRLQLLAA